MSSDDGGDKIYDVERILAEKIDDEDVHVYLVKWDGYSDEECTWEPAENFTHPDALQMWAAQKAHGDTLDAYDLQRIQDQMDTFRIRQVSDADTEDKQEIPHSPSSPVDVDQPHERPKKRFKLISHTIHWHDEHQLMRQMPKDSPPAKRCITHSVKSTSPQRRVIKLSKTDGTLDRSSFPQASKQYLHEFEDKLAAPALLWPVSIRKPIAKAAPAPPHLPSRASIPSPSTTSTPKPPMAARLATTMTASAKPLSAVSTDKSVHDEPQKFFGLEMRNQVRAKVLVKRDNTVKRFNSYQNMNSAPKKMIEDQPQSQQPPPSKTKATEEHSEEQIPERAQGPLPQNASWLFFEDYDDEESRKMALEQSTAPCSVVSDHHETTSQKPIYASNDQQPRTAMVQPDTTPQGPVGLKQAPALAPLGRPPLKVNTQSNNANQRTDEVATNSNGNFGVRGTRLQDVRPVPASSATSQHQKRAVKLLAETNPTTNIDDLGVFGSRTASCHTEDPLVEGGKTRTRPRRKSILDRSFGKSSAVVDTQRDVSPQVQLPQHEPPEALASTGTRTSPTLEARSGMPTACAQDFVSFGEVVRASNGREWQKGKQLITDSGL